MNELFGLLSMGMAFLAGLFMGKSGKVGEEKEREEVTANGQKAALSQALYDNRKAPAGSKRIPLGFGIGSPVVGEMEPYEEQEGNRIKIYPSQGKVYAPASGKITRVFPTGNAMRLKTDQGLELLIQAGIGTEELEGEYYRARVVKNEIVGKGKLLLEYDIESIVQEGYDPALVITVEDARDFADVTVMNMDKVRVGDNLMWVNG